MKLKDRYKLNKSAKIGDKITCPSCGTEFIKTQHQQAFCKSKSGTICKDKYWNTVTPKKRCNTTRISPANKRWQEHRNEDMYGCRMEFDNSDFTYDEEEYDVFFDMNV